MGKSELASAERILEINTRKLAEKNPQLALVYQESCRRLIGLHTGKIESNVQKLLLINGRPARDWNEEDLPPAA